MDKKVKTGQLVFYDKVLIGYIERVQHLKDGSSVIQLRVPYADIPQPRSVVTTNGKRLTIKVGAPEQRGPQILAPSNAILGANGRPVRIA